MEGQLEKETLIVKNVVTGWQHITHRSKMTLTASNANATSGNYHAFQASMQLYQSTISTIQF